MDFITDALINLDWLVLYFVNMVATHPWLDLFFINITDLHKSPYFFLVMFPLFIGLFYWKYKKNGFFIFFALLICLGFTDFFGNQAFKKTVQRPRPADTPGVRVEAKSPYGGYSFTSNHAANMFALATYSSQFVPIVRVPVYTMAFLASYSRVYNGVHFPSDVIVGGLFGSLWGFLFSWLVRKLLRWKESKT